MNEWDERIERARAKWRYTGQRRPPFARAPGPGQESVWDYPRPPRLMPDRRRVRVMAGAVVIADTRCAVRVLETGGPPTFYLPPEDVRTERLLAAPDVVSFCEWKGEAEYYSVQADGHLIREAAWCYRQPFEAFRAIAGYYSFYPGKLACYVGEEIVQPQPGSYYGGWVTKEIVGPFKGEPGTEEW